MFETLFYLTGGLCVSLIVVLVQLHKGIHRVECEVKALTAENTELKKQRAKDYEDFRDATNKVREYYDAEKERRENPIANVRSGGLHVKTFNFDEAIERWLNENDRRWREMPAFKEAVQKIKQRFRVDPPVMPE